MFNVIVDVVVSIKGCPKDGIECVDFRRSKGFSDLPRNSVPVKWAKVSEPFCRRFKNYLNADGDLILKSFEPCKLPLSPTGMPPIPAETLLPLFSTDCTIDHVAAFLDVAMAEAEAVRLDKEKAEEDKKAEAAKQEAKAEADKKAYAEAAALKLQELGEWVETSDIASERTKLMREEGFEGWIASAIGDRKKYLMGLIRGVVSRALSVEPGPGPEEAEAGDMLVDSCEQASSEERKHPELPELLFLRRVKKEMENVNLWDGNKVARFTMTAKLMYTTYSFEGRDDIDRPELRVTAEWPDAEHKVKIDFVIPDPSELAPYPDSAD